MEKNLKRLYVGNLPWKTTSDDLRNHFANYGRIIDVVIPVDRETDRIKGFGFVEFSTASDAETAQKALDGQDFSGRALRIDFATDRAQR